MGGIMDLTGEPDGPPEKTGVAIVDLFTGLYGVVAVQAALALRARTGRGQHIDMALFDVQLAMLANQATNWLIGGRLPRRMGNAHPNIAPYQVFEAADGPLIIACGNDGQFARMCGVLGLGLHEDPRFARNRDRLENRAALLAALGPAIGGRNRAEVLAAMETAGVPAGSINTVAEAFAEPQAVHRGMTQRIGESVAPRSPMRFSAAGLATDRPPPDHDAHGAAIRAALAAGVDWPRD
jgi:crotonobetainyl-CoA:carnitine CoA-transferase CaiB-like acyl-CoA transferase